MGQEAQAQLALDQVVLMPVATPPHKQLADDPGAEQRYELCRLAVATDGRFAVSRLEIDRGGASYTVDTLRAIHASAPGDDLTFIVGGDMARSLPAWREPEAVLELATLAVAEREGIGRAEILESVSAIPGAAERIRFFDMPRVDVSSSAVRRRVRHLQPIRYLVPDEVVRVIGAQGYYRQEGSA